MSKAVIIPMPGNEGLATRLSAFIESLVGEVETRTFPDGETYVRLRTPVRGRRVVLLSTLDRPDPKFLPLAFAAAAARDLGAVSIGLIAPYLAYMRQDRRFHPGEAITSAAFATLLSSSFEWVVTIDPHLHRYSSLAEIYSSPTRVVHAAPLMAEWIRTHIANPLLIGPDAESRQWVADVAQRAGAPYRVLRKERRGDRDVEITLPAMDNITDRMPVLVDDIVSSGHTMIEAARQLTARGLPAPVCMTVHALFAGESYRTLKMLGARIVSTDTVPHDSNAIETAAALAVPVGEFLQPRNHDLETES